MLKDNLRSLYRYIIRHKFYTLFNVIGLATGLTAALLILFYIQDELNYDRHYENHERIYRFESTFVVNNNPDPYATFPVPLGPALKREIPEIQEITRIHVAGEMLMAYGEKKFYEWGFVYADSTLFKVFSHDIIRGNPLECLTEPYSIVLTESTASRYFGDEDPLGKILTDGNDQGYRVTAIIRDLPANTHLKYDAMISMTTMPEVYNTTKPSRFWRVILYTYALINENATIEDVHRKFQDFYEREMEPLGTKFNVSFELMTTPLKDTHFRQGLIAEQPSGNKAYLVIFSAIALFILVVVAINYMNMATARSANRSKEVGVRKVLGADRKQLVWQFMGESISLSIMALLIAVLLVSLFMGSVNDFTGKEMRFNIVENPIVLLGIIVITIAIGLGSGSYPAFYLSSFQPSIVLKGHMSSAGKGNRNLRRFLVAVQFFIAVFMVISSMVVTGQLDFLRSKDLGYEPENLVLLQSGGSSFQAGTEAFKNELLQNPAVMSVTNSHGIPGILRWIRSMKIEQEEGMIERSILYLEADYDFCTTYEIERLQGRDFDRAMGTDSLEAVLINQTAALEFGWASEPLGKKIHYGFGQDGSGGRMLKVIGVVKDFHFHSLHNAIEPLIIFIQESPGDLLSIRLRPERQEETLRFIEEKWMEFGASIPFRYEFLEDRLNETYAADDKTGTIIRLGALFIIILALFGLLGLSSFVAEQKTKEVGIRKIHGASTWNILAQLYKDFVTLFFLAFLLAVPFAWWRLSLWLEEEFVYYADITWQTYIYAGFFCILIGTGTISYFIIRAARGNPVDAIKYE